MFKLTTRELEVLSLIAQGFTGSEVGIKLDITLRMVKGHLTNIFTKLNAVNAVHAVAIAISRDLLVLDEEITR